MNFLAIVVVFVASIARVQARSAAVPHDEVQPFAQPVPTTDAQKAAVNKVLEWGGAQNLRCKGSPFGSQVYARSAWVENKWAIMYAWYFPKGTAPLNFGFFGHRHNWEIAIVWLTNPTANSTILGVSLSAAIGWSKEAPPKEKYLDGDSLKVAYYYSHLLGTTALEYTEDAGEF
ncbi:unnamed protein product [Phytophthora lilii]|uniref:Unnamed protein product n=1 Tax=Phytophthora lilii TaxID=2077276 RepID=A0A9W6XJ65_9STRA|nr:unnamed protein product [Phytophthora lilii]